MKIGEELVEGVFLARDNRFRVTVEVDGSSVWAHLPNSGRLAELLIPGRRVVLVRREGRKRLTRFDLAMVETPPVWVSVDARLPNDLFEEALRMGRVPAFAGYSSVRREVTFGQSRLDFLLEEHGRRPCLVEIKSVTLVIDDLGFFPDAVTERGRRHLAELSEATKQGYRTAVVFVIQRNDAQGLRPHDESDAAFGKALRQAHSLGVEVHAFACRVEPDWIEFDRGLCVVLD
jgi:sugar fermentation stimulation protein A